ncbi:helix-turn-helix protein [Nocardia tenerifensis]|uniref:Helix-turn-helix protein n=1 Tax=Nocardia tenerifensis TaxID=228006 RepID=A0A318KCB7_9NOCA|nr:peptidoglycan-binding domain-containing protein [Nocardia tenerifensis]PXX71766.1 helix-turn-helix protein [Nocardia tenerifensis]
MTHDLATRLQELRQRSRLGLRFLAGATDCEMSCWKGYLRGTAVPPLRVVEQAARHVRLSAVDTRRLLAAWEEATLEQAPAQCHCAPLGEPPPAPSARQAWRGGAAVSLAALTVVAAGAAVRQAMIDHPTAPAPAAATSIDFQCRYATHTGLLYAGHSESTSRVIASGASGQDVIEVQCLLSSHHIDPKGIDGVYGSDTRHAVEQLQKAAGLAPDGMVGPKTWAALRDPSTAVASPSPSSGR